MIKRREIDFTHGPLLKNMILYALPIIGVNVLQLLFTAADLSVLGIVTKNDSAIAAVGASTNIVNLLVGAFTGLTLSANVAVARCKGAKDMEKSRRFVGTSMFCSIFFGLIITVVGILCAESFLRWTDCPESVLPYAATYLRIYFLGAPVLLIYNFSASILRAVGDTVRPLYFLIIGGAMNVVLNVFFVAVVGWDIEGVAVATVASNAFCAVATLTVILKNDGYAKLERRYFRISREELRELLVVGLPLALSKSLFSIANVLTITEINRLGEAATTSYSVTKEFDGFILEASHAIGAANLAVVSQNYGAHRMDRVKRVLGITFLLQLAVCGTLGVALLFVGRSLCSILTDTELVLDLCFVRITTVSIAYIFNGSISMVQEGIRGIGYSFTSLMNSMFSNIVIRIIYLKLVLPHLMIEGEIAYNLRMIYLLYPASWILGTFSGLAILLVLYRRVKRRFAAEAATAPVPATAG